jgi:hypothetical protein
MTRCNKNKIWKQRSKFFSCEANFLVERFVADRSVRLTLPSNHLPRIAIGRRAPAHGKYAERDGDPGQIRRGRDRIFSAAC